ncbi:MAG TPA: hypothetical protein VFR24_27825 [Candidatus Angelobacter sp.]|nr:hypothetical protein [Candidatus Angelobacter sp.]
MPLILAVLGIAFIVWMMRTAVESDPDPFFLNLTFFAFAGQCIRTGESVKDGKLDVQLVYLLVIGFATLFGQVLVMKAHMKTTLKYYKGLLDLHKSDGCQKQEIHYWADRLLEITGVDFAPGNYSWLILFNTEPREKRRLDAFSILPESDFKTTQFSPQSLIVPLDKRKLLWSMYRWICLISWIIFIVAIIFSAKAC